MAKIKWTEATYEGCKSDSKLKRREKMVAWKADRMPGMQVLGGPRGAELGPDDIDWRGCIRLHDAGKDTRNVCVLMRVSQSERKLLEKRARRAGKPLTTWIRSIALAAAASDAASAATGGGD